MYKSPFYYYVFSNYNNVVEISNFTSESFRTLFCQSLLLINEILGHEYLQNT
jgi:hypothetical protein